MKGGLRLDSYEPLMEGGKDGPVIVPGKPEQSLLLQRVTLPPDHKHFMPAEGKPPFEAGGDRVDSSVGPHGASPTATQ